MQLIRTHKQKTKGKGKKAQAAMKEKVGRRRRAERTYSQVNDHPRSSKKSVKSTKDHSVKKNKSGKVAKPLVKTLVGGKKVNGGVKVGFPHVNSIMRAILVANNILHTTRCART
jgi:hypothetical protein